MPGTQEPLFCRRPMQDLIQAQRQAIKKEVESVPANTLLNASEYDLVAALVESFRLDVPVIRDKDVYIASSAELRPETSGEAARLRGC